MMKYIYLAITFKFLEKNLLVMLKLNLMTDVNTIF